jgi:hypothetical protein
MSQNTLLGRKSYDRLPNIGPQYFTNSTASETLHMSFIKRPAELEYLEPLKARVKRQKSFLFPFSPKIKPQKESENSEI